MLGQLERVQSTSVGTKSKNVLETLRESRRLNKSAYFKDLYSDNLAQVMTEVYEFDESIGQEILDNSDYVVSILKAANKLISLAEELSESELGTVKAEFSEWLIEQKQDRAGYFLKIRHARFAA